MSLQHVPSLQHQARLSFVPEGPANQLSNRRSVVADALQQLESRKLSAASRTSSDTQLYGPIRRRSLLQHGVATRNSWVESDSRKTLPSQLVASPVDLPQYSYTPEPPAQPLQQLSRIETKMLDHFRHPRVSTPDSMDYSHIGSFKLGSLRITNGAASPEPLERANTTGAEDDYMSAGHARQASHPRSQTISGLQDTIKAPWITTTESPLQTVVFSEPESLPLSINTEPNLQYATYSFADSPTKSLDLAREYQDLALSPFSFDHSPTSPMLQSRSKHMAAEDDLFALEPATPEVTSFPARRSVDSGFQPEETERPKYFGKGGKELPMKPLAKADSGYSSNVSIRSFKNKAPAVPAKEAPPTPPKGPVSRVASSAYSVASDAGSAKSDKTISAKRSLPALPKEDMLQTFGAPPKVPRKKSFQNLKIEKNSRTTVTKSQSQLLLNSKSHEKSKSISNISKPSLESRISQSSSGSDVSSASSSSRWRRNSKSKVVAPSQPVYTVQAAPSHAEQMNIPTPSAEATRHLEKRVDSFPTASIPNSLPAMRRSVSKETLKTIFSVGSAEYREELTIGRLQSALPAVPTPIEEEPKTNFSRRHTFQPEAPAPTPSSRKPIQRHTYVPQQVTRAFQDTPERKPRRDFETEITSFESVSSSVGNSPYDVAISSSDRKQRKEQRTKSMTEQLKVDTTAQLAQSRASPSPARSLHRTSSYGSINYENQPSSPMRTPRIFGRPPSVHGNMNAKTFTQRSSPNLRGPQPPMGEQQPSPLQHSQHSMTDLRDGIYESMASMTRLKSPPPVSMKTQGRAVPLKVKTSSRSSTPKVPSISSPSSPAPNRPPPRASSTTPTSAAKSTKLNTTKSTESPNNAWASQESYWASRKREALQTRKSMEMQRPEQARRSFEVTHGIQLRRPESARPSSGGQRRPGKFSSWDTSNQKWDGYGSQSVEYDHTYGTYTSSKGEGDAGAYYDGGYQQQEQISQRVHSRSTSTSDMFALDGFGLASDVGYGPLAAAGSRKTSGRADADFGVDMSDVPVLRRVKVES